MTDLVGEINHPYGNCILAADGVSYLLAKGEVRKFIEELETSGLIHLATENPERQPWQKYNLNGLVVLFTVSSQQTKQGVPYAVNVHLSSAQPLLQETKPKQTLEGVAKEGTHLQ